MEAVVRVKRNRLKFQMKYGFDVVSYTELAALGLDDGEIARALDIPPAALENYRLRRQKQKERKGYAWFDSLLLR